eukprot:768379-Hanusia_phi.AAC.4
MKFELTICYSSNQFYELLRHHAERSDRIWICNVALFRGLAMTDLLETIPSHALTRQWQKWDFPDKAIYITTKQYANYVGSGKTAEFLSRKVIAEVYPWKLGVSEAAVNKMIEMVGPRYNAKKKMIKITATERPNREMNSERIKWQVHCGLLLTGSVYDYPAQTGITTYPPKPRSLRRNRTIEEHPNDCANRACGRCRSQ